MKDRVCNHRQTTIAGIAVLIFLCVLIWRVPQSADNPASLITMAAGLAGIFLRDGD